MVKWNLQSLRNNWAIVLLLVAGPVMASYFIWGTSRFLWSHFHELSWAVVFILGLVDFWCLIAMVGLVLIWLLLASMYREEQRYPTATPTPSES